MTAKSVVASFFAIHLSACCVVQTPMHSDAVSTAERAKAYFSVYAARQDFHRFMTFYADNAQLHDVIYGYSAHGKSDIAAFFAWDRGDFSTVASGPILQVTRQVVSGDQVITTGQFNQFHYNGQKLGPWEFVIWQQYSADGLILQQQDWINYSPKKILINP
jgi:ketosteroid isomerase-like protein